MSNPFHRNSASNSMHSSVSQTSLQSSDNSRGFDFDGLEESLVDDSRDDEDDTDDAAAPFEASFHRIRNALIRDSHNRSDEDLDVIDDFVALVARQNASQTTALAQKDVHTRRLLAKHMVLAEIEARDTRVLTHGERLDAFCVVACGSLRHVVGAEGESCVDCEDPRVRLLQVGAEFGASLDDRVVFGEIYTNDDFVWVLCVPHVVFDDICGQKTFRTLFDQNSQQILEIRNSATDELARASKDRLLDLLFADETTRDDRRDDDSFIADFLLTFRLFFGADCVRELLARVVDNLTAERATDRNVKIALFWIANHFQDFDAQSVRALDAAIRAKTHKKLFYLTLSSKSRDRQVTLTRSDRAAALPFTLVGGYECSSRLFVGDVTPDADVDLQRADRLLSINGVDCHVMEVARALQLCRASTHVSLQVRFDPSLFDALIDGQHSRHNDTKRHDVHKTTQSSFASLKPIQQLSSQSLSSSVVSANNANNNWKQKVRQIVQNVTTRDKPVATTGETTTDAPPDVIKIHYESDFRYLPIHATTSARECIQLALIEFALNASFSSRDFALYEYKVLDRTSMTSAVKRLSDNSQNLVQNLSLDSRFYLKCVTSPTAALNETEITREISRESHDNSLLCLDGEAIARELTDRDFDAFCRIESQQFIDDLTDDTSDDSRRQELKRFEERTNREMFWTINQVLFAAQTPAKRVKAVKQLIRVAAACKHMQNFNSLFAILSGLSHGSVERQKHALWDRVPSRALQKLHKLYALMDPSRNFHHFRSALRRCAPPVIPFFPLVKKDLSFIFLANETLVCEPESKQMLVNWEKMRLLSQKVREVQQMTHKTTPTTSATTATRKSSTLSSQAAQHLKSALNDSKESHYRKQWERQRMKKRVQHFLDSSFACIVCDENLLFEKSVESEPQTSQSQRSSQTLSSAPSQQQLSSAVMPSPTLSSHSSSPSLSSSTTNSSDVQSTNSAQQRMRFGVKADDTGLRKLLALSDVSSRTAFADHAPHLLHSNYFVSDVTASRLSAPTALSMSSHFKQTLPQESSSVTSLRQQLQQMSRFRDPSRPLAARHVVPPTYDQTIQRMKKKFSEENVV